MRHRLPDPKVREFDAESDQHQSLVGVSTPQGSAYRLMCKSNRFAATRLGTILQN